MYSPLPPVSSSSWFVRNGLQVPEDEDIFNIGIWEEGGTKMWCKIDQVGVDEFDGYLAGHKDNKCIHQYKCGDIMADPRFHPIGVAKAFFTAHHAVDPFVETPRYLHKLKEMQAAGTLPPPIMFHQRFFPDGEAVKAAFPKATCLV